LIAYKSCIGKVEFYHNQLLLVGVTQMYIIRGVYLRDAILVTKIFCYQYSTFNSSVKK